MSMLYLCWLIYIQENRHFCSLSVRYVPFSYRLNFFVEAQAPTDGTLLLMQRGGFRTRSGKQIRGIIDKYMNNTSKIRKKETTATTTFRVFQLLFQIDNLTHILLIQFRSIILNNATLVLQFTLIIICKRSGVLNIHRNHKHN